jgi:hypothetical protein
MLTIGNTMLTIGNLFLEWNYCATSAPCVSCGARTNHEIGFAWYAGDPVAPVCDECIRRIRPGLLRGRDVRNAMPSFQELRERQIPPSRQEVMDAHKAEDRRAYDVNGFPSPCPVCYGENLYIPLDKESWMVCESCRISWCYGIGIFTNPYLFEPGDRERAEAQLSQFAPVLPTPFELLSELLSCSKVVFFEPSDDDIPF